MLSTVDLIEILKGSDPTCRGSCVQNTQLLYGLIWGRFDQLDTRQ